MIIYFDYGLPFTEVCFVNGGNSITLSKVLIDTGSKTSLISTETAIELGLDQQPDDEVNIIRGIGGIESVYEKRIEKIVLDGLAYNNFKLDVGAMLYGFDFDAIIGSDFLRYSKAIVNFDEMTLTPVV
jgi:hypothetical protein